MDGHLRLKAARHMGLETVPVALADGLSDAQIKAFRLLANRSVAWSEWDNDLLRIEMEELRFDGFDLALTGFDTPEITRILASRDRDDADDVPEAPPDPASRLGDVWLLGRHRLVCGDSTNPADVDRALAGVRPHLMVTDPPYGVKYDADWRNHALRSDGTAIAGRAIGKVGNDDRADWSSAWSLFPGDVAYCWHAGRHASTVQASLEESGFIIRCQIVWAKQQFAIGRGDYHWQHEPCWYAVRKGATGHLAGDRKQSTLWQIDKPVKSETGHSTQKPVECMKRPIENNSSPGQAVYEPFSGSGTTIIAAEITGRCCHAIELNAAYVDVAILRWQSFVGQDAIHEQTGKTFAEMGENRMSA